MNQSSTTDTIIHTTTALMASQGAHGLSMRDIAQQAGIAPSVLYHHFANKDDLLKATFDSINTSLGEARRQLPPCNNASELLLQRILFQLEHMEEVVAVLKYYLAYRHLYAKEPQGVLPVKAYLHMLEVLEFGMAKGELTSNNPEEDAQVMTHAVNGFLLEYFPESLSDLDRQGIALKLHRFLWRALKGGDTDEFTVYDR